MNTEEVVVIPPEWIVPTGSEIEVDTRIGIGYSIIAVIATYIAIVWKIGPSLMKSRPAYKLKEFIILYNIYQILACAYLIRLILIIDLPTLTYGACIDFKSGTVVEKDFNHISTFIFWLKASELTETFVFVLRKKNKQISFLHVFHHSAILFLAFNLNKTYKSSSALFPVFINSSVHIVMYSYYLMAAVLPSKIVARLTPFKKFITTIQMIQFVIVLFQIVVAKSRGCRLPEIMLVIYTSIIIVVFYGFYDFYKKSYIEAVKEKEKKQKLKDNQRED